MLDGRQLRIFLLVAELRHFGRAAERIGLAPSAVSAQIRRLEDRLGGPLFLRGRRAAVTLTPAGAAFRPEAEAALGRLAQAERIGRLACGGAAGPVAVGYVFSAAMCGLLTRLLAMAAARFPDLAVAAHPMHTPDQLAALADGRLDAALVRPRARYPEGVDARPIHREGLMVALGRDHPLAAEPAIRAADLRHERFIVPQFGEPAGLSDTVADLARAGGFAPPATTQVGDFVTAASFAAAGAGVVLAPASLGRLGLPGLAYRPVAGFEGVVTLAYAWRRGGLDAIAELGAALAA